ncbi:MAG TPA: hypothetical protein PLL06_09540 [Acidobacteriota bacterium]|nr:hypothetical protein [Acidobacteriota bacterium]HNH84396.1 hypothetical protein [Acidobacteriota bacterium]
MALRKRSWRFLEAFGPSDESFLPDIPSHLGSRMMSRIANCRERGGCSHCYPHGPETPNAKLSKNRRSWKYYRKRQYHLKDYHAIPREREKSEEPRVLQKSVELSEK